MDSAQKKRIKEQKKNSQRIFRVVEQLDFGAIYDDSPIEVLEGYIVADREDYKCFAVFKLQSASKKNIKAVSIRLLCYEYSNIPYMKLPFEYSCGNVGFGARSLPETKTEADKKKKKKKTAEPPHIRYGETFGEAVYIELPERYFKRFELETVSVTYEDGSVQQLHEQRRQKRRTFDELDDEALYAYDTVNIYKKAEEHFPATVFPTQNSNVWLCCCGAKNLNDFETCSVCHREKAWQFDNLTRKALDAQTDTLKAKQDPRSLHLSKSKLRSRELEEKEEIKKKKAEEYEKVMENLARQQRESEHNKAMIIPRVIFYFAVFYGIIFALQLLIERTS